MGIGGAGALALRALVNRQCLTALSASARELDRVELRGTVAPAARAEPAEITLRATGHDPADHPASSTDGGSMLTPHASKLRRARAVFDGTFGKGGAAQSTSTPAASKIPGSTMQPQGRKRSSKRPMGNAPSPSVAKAIAPGEFDVFSI